MRKTIEVEYVGIEDVQEIIDDAYAIMREGHYVNVEFSSIIEPPGITIKMMLGGWDSGKDFDYLFRFDISDNPEDVKKMNECKCILNNILAEE